MCFFKELTGYPCPGCGCTRALKSLFYGNIKQALWYNPVVFLLAAGIGAAIVITIVDVIKHKVGLKMRDCYVYKLMHRQLPLWVVIISVSFALVNWVWNILKGL
ncbi:MAG: DUF2752 domain-containing protein [Bacteroidales bacterium]|nr:DUF2752 domain-containing protein [Bacteroidales bacterium]MBR4715027.1 DUF2752 domain-containing protein [Bacteroidales bacterium]